MVLFNPDNPLGAIRYDSPSTVRPELVEGLVPQRGMVRQAHHERSIRQAHHERSNGLSGFNMPLEVVLAAQGFFLWLDSCLRGNGGVLN